MDGVDPEPGAGAVRARAAVRQHATRRVPWQPASTAPSVGSMQDRQVAVEPAAALAGDPAEAVALGLDLLVVVEDEGDVVRGLRAGDADRRPAAASPRRRPSCRWCRSRTAGRRRRRGGWAGCRRSARCRGARPARSRVVPVRGWSGPAPRRRPAPPPGPPSPRSAASTASASACSSPDTDGTSTSGAGQGERRRRSGRARAAGRSRLRA